MARFLKLIGSGKDPCPEPYLEPYIDFSPTRNPRGKVNIGDKFILYAAGGRQRIFAEATVVSDSYGGENIDWPFRLDVVYSSNVPPAEGVLIDEMNVDRDLGVALRRQSYIRLEDSEFDRASRLLAVAQSRFANSQKFFTTYWKNDTWVKNANALSNGSLLDHTASDNFVTRGVSTGDAIYAVTALKGRLNVAAKIIVSNVLGTEDAEVALGRTDLWEASDHIIASHSTPIDWQREIPIGITRRLEFVSSNGALAPLVFRSTDELDEQTLRGVRRLATDSAKLLDEYLGALRPIEYSWSSNAADGIASLKEFESYAEGKKGFRYVTYYERDPKNRADAIRIHGVSCKGCGMNFEKTYGILGKDFIHVHHVEPVSQFEKPKQIDPRTDLTVLCPNCHAMVHRKKTKTLSVEELQSLIHQASRG